MSTEKGKNSKGTYFKAVSSWRFFAYSITKSPTTLKEPYLSDRELRDQKEKLPYGRRIDGVYPVTDHQENKHRKPLFDEKTKQGWLINKKNEQPFPFPFSKHQSTSYYEEGFYSPAFPGLIDKAETCLGMSCPAQMEGSEEEMSNLPYIFQDAKNIHALSPPNRVMIHNDRASFGRYYLSATREEAEKIYQEEVNANRFFHSINDLVKRGDRNKLNEIMLRFRWICHGSSQLTAFKSSNPLATNIELQIRAHDLEQRLRAWHEECGLDYSPNYKVPLGSYVPNLEGYRISVSPKPPTDEERKALRNISVISQEPFALFQYNDQGEIICSLTESELKELGLKKGVELRQNQFDDLDASVLRKGGRVHQNKAVRKYTKKQQKADFEYALQSKTKEVNPKSYDLARFLELQRRDFVWAGGSYTIDEIITFTHLASDLTYESSLLFYENFILKKKKEIVDALKESNKLHLYIDIYRCIPPHRRKEFIKEPIDNELMPYFIHSLLKMDGLEHDTAALLELAEAKSDFKFNSKGEGINPVLVAALNQKSYPGEESVISYLIEHGAKVSAPSGQDSPLKIAVKNNKKTVVDLLLKRGATSSADENGALPLHLAVGKGYRDIAFSLIAHHPTSLDHEDDNGYTPLHHGIKHGHLELVKEIISNLDRFRQILSQRHGERWVDRRFSNTLIFDPLGHEGKLLSLAIEKKDLELVKLLQHHGAILKDKDRLSLVSLYIRNGEFESASSLLNSKDLQDAQVGVDAELIKQRGQEILNWAIENNKKTLCQFLLLNNVTPTPASIVFLKKKLGQLLHLAIKNQCVGLVRLLSENENIDVNEGDSQGFTPLYNASKQAALHFAVLERLKARPVEEPGVEGAKKLVIEANAGNYEIIDLLLNQNRAYCYPSVGEQHPYTQPLTPEVKRKKTFKKAAIALTVTSGAAYGIYALIDDPAIKAYIIENTTKFIALGSVTFFGTILLIILLVWAYRLPSTRQLLLEGDKETIAKLIAERQTLLENNKANINDSKLSLSENSVAENKKKLESEAPGFIPPIQAISTADNSEVISSIKKEIKIFTENYSKDEQRNMALQNLNKYPPVLVAEEWHKNKLNPDLICKIFPDSLYPMHMGAQVAFENWVTQFSIKMHELDNSVMLQAKSIILFSPPPHENLVVVSNIINHDDALIPSSKNTS